MQAKSKGQIIIIVALSLVVLIAMVGLAIDLGRAYGVKAKLSSAVDAAAIAAGRALAGGASQAERISNAQVAGPKYYYANFPNDYLGATPDAPTVTAIPNTPDPGKWTVNVTGSAQMPITFLRVLNALPGVTISPTIAVGATGQAIRRDVDVMLVLDTSGSLATPAGTLGKLQNAAKTCFVNNFASGPGGDRVGFVRFASGAELGLAIDKTATRGFDKTALTNAISIPASPTGSTAQAEGMRLAFNDINGIPATMQSSLRAIVFFSDGAPNDVSAQFPLSSGAQVTGDLYSETSGLENGIATLMYNNARRDTQLGNNATYAPPNPTVAGLPLQGLGAVDLASFNGVRVLAMNGAIYANSRCNVNKAARNMVENLANTARSQGIVIYTVGLGGALTTLEPAFSGSNCGYSSNASTSTETGGHILKRLANASPTAPRATGDPTLANDKYNSAQPTGLYLYAGNVDDVCTAFSTIASEILRLSQ